MIPILPQLQAVLALLASRGLFSARRSRRPVFANIAAGTHAGYVTRTASSAFSSKNLLAKNSVTAGQVAPCGASDAPAGIATDEAAVGEPLAVKVLGAGDQTALLTASAAVSAGATLFSAASGKVQAEPTSAGTYYLVGRALTAATGDGDFLEAETCVPLKLVVLAAPGNTDNEIGALTIGATYSQAEVQALRAKCEELADDYRALAAALATPALVKVLES